MRRVYEIENSETGELGTVLANNKDSALAEILSARKNDDWGFGNPTLVRQYTMSDALKHIPDLERWVENDLTLIERIYIRILRMRGGVS